MKLLTTFLITSILFACPACKSVKINSTKVLEPGDSVAFVAGEPKGAMVNVTIDLNSIVFKNKKDKARFNIPDVSQYTTITGWFIYNVNTIDPQTQETEETQE